MTFAPNKVVCRDFVGRKVRLLRTLQTKGGTPFAQGTVLEVMSTCRGRFSLQTKDDKGFATGGIHHVNRKDLELLPEDL